VPASIIFGAVNLSIHSNALRVVPLHASSEKYIFVPVIISTRETNSNASGFTESTMMITISHDCNSVPLHGGRSIQSTVAVILPVFPKPSTNSKVNEPLLMNVCVSPHILVIVTGSFNHVKVAITLPIVGVAGRYSIVQYGCIRFTIAVALPVFPARSLNSNINDQFPVKS
jgi:hypothetical protein